MTSVILDKKNELEAVENNILNTPELKDLSSEQLEKIAELVIIQRYTNQMNKEVDLMQYNYNELKETFLSSGRFNSDNTRNAYRNALRHFENYLEERSIQNPLAIDCALADDFIYTLRNENKSASTVRQFTGAVSSFFSFVERRSNGTIKNIFRGTKARPASKTNKTNKFYNIAVNENTLKDLEKDFDVIMSNINNKELKTILLIMKETGLRVGAFSASFQIRGSRFITETKGKEFAGNLPENCLKAIRNAGLKHSNTFENWNDKQLKNLIKYHTKRLFNKGLISYSYSAHDLRHYYAIKKYNETKDIHLVSKLLGHSSIAITENYLKGLNVII